ncbi:alpha/beta hydrolase [Mycolicibacterium moriokaense]|nr:alpha/beta hydrolase [Mycolicibacterium moriokaense]
MPEIQLEQGLLRYQDCGSGPCVLLVHGLFVDSRVWDPLVSEIEEQVRCVRVDLPLGAHRVPMNNVADLSPPGLARMIAEFIERLQLDDVTVVGNDTGGALCQILCANHPELVGRLVLTNCDAFENFPPRVAKLIEAIGAHVPGSIAGLDLVLRVRLLRKASLMVAPLTTRPLPDELLSAWFSSLHDPRVRADLRAVLQGISSKHTLAAAERLRAFDRPALIVWGARDWGFPVSDAERLAETLPCSRLEIVEDARTYVQFDQPQRLADLLLEHVG